MTTIIIIILSLILVINTIGAIITVFRQSRDIAATWAWLLVLILLPVIGFGFYLFFGKKLSAEHLYDLRTQAKLGIDERVTQQKAELRQRRKQNHHSTTPEIQSLINLFLVSNTAVLTQENKVSVLTDTTTAQERLLADMSRARDHIHLEYYAFFDDPFGHILIKTLAYKAYQGVKVRVIYDGFGSQKIPRSFFKPLEEAGGQVTPFFSSRFRLINFRLNFRNHRQLVVIDGNTAYLGNFNQHSVDTHLPVRDTRLRISGDGVLSFQSRFFMDWNAATQRQKVYYSQHYFPTSAEHGQTSMQLVSGGPDRDLPEIKLGFLKLIAAAKKRLWIQTPFFIPDDSVLAALILAINSGVTVKIMIPEKAKHSLVQHANLYYARQIVKAGGQIYLYKASAFRARTMMVDGQLSAVGTANLDIRSFKLNFETTSFLYDPALTNTLELTFQRDLKDSVPLTKQQLNAQTTNQRLSQDLARLLAPIL
ncbi:cardiolipin synthase [Latilactobacillus sakei]|uniref:cardiolipin synthase n=1 Tax=Latilactobacillus sakei TaxID=1599 RepID=UPI00388B8E16